MPVLEWQDEQLVAPVWFITAGVQAVPMAWQLPQVLPVMGAIVCALAPLVGRPALGALVVAVLWHPVKQSVAAVTPLCVTVAGSHAEVRWQAEHWDAVLT